MHQISFYGVIKNDSLLLHGPLLIRAFAKLGEIVSPSMIEQVHLILSSGSFIICKVFGVILESLIESLSELWNLTPTIERGMGFIYGKDV